VLTITQAAAIVETPTLSISPEQNEVQFKADGTTDGNATFVVTTNQTAWDAVSNQAWLTVTKTATGFTLVAAANPSYTVAPAPATVTVSATGVANIVMNVTQATKPVPADGVLINGIVWAKYNVDAPGTFATTPGAYGMFYQWNRNIGWSSTNPMTNSNGGTTWDDSVPEGTEWTAANDPSPAGWRVPTNDEQQTLFASDKVTNEWVTTPTAGRLFTDNTSGNTLFLPAAGLRYTGGGMLGNAGSYGYYWSSTKYGSTDAYYLYVQSGSGSGSAGAGYTIIRRYGFPVRCVAE
jgi:uncharacterized protein (TIGR02145 family)